MKERFSKPELFSFGINNVTHIKLCYLLKDLEINQEPTIASGDIKMTTAGEREVCKVHDCIL